VLSQSHALFRLVVLDNASSDGSLEWLQSLQDPRIRIHMSSTPLSIEDSWGRIHGLESSDEYLTIIGHDDALDRDFLSGMSGLIDQFPDAKLYDSRFRLIDSGGRTIRNSLSAPFCELSHQYLAARLAFNRDSFGTGYVTKMKDFIEVGGMPRYRKLMFADDALWIKLMEGSYKATLQSVSFSYRVHSGSTSFAPDWRSTFDALYCYLDLLVGQAKANKGIYDVMSQGVAKYLIFWLRWGYFSLPARQQSAEEFRRIIDVLICMVAPVLGPERVAIFSRNAEAAVFGTAAWPRWMLWRGYKWVRSRITPNRHPNV
jgi:glycosyltransferase involved in cell wall biosynthesis